MKIIYKFRDYSIEARGSPLFLLTNGAGGYLALGDAEFSNFCGAFHFIPQKWTLFKYIENIWIDLIPDTLINHLNSIERISNRTTERFFWRSDLLVYEVSNYWGFVNIDLDFREIYDFDDQGRIYNIYKEGDSIVVEYKKFSDNSLSQLRHSSCLLIQGASEFEPLGQWIRKEYKYDRERGSRFIFYIYRAFRIKVAQNLRLLLYFAENKEGGFARIKRATEREKQDEGYRIRNEAPKAGIAKKEDVVRQIAQSALNSLIISPEAEKSIERGIFAGLPWFFQFWSRDELISIKAIILQGDFALAKKILLRYLNLIQPDGRLPNIYSQRSTNADSIGWLSKRLHDFLRLLAQKKLLEQWFQREELLFIAERLNASIDGILKTHSKYGLIWNDKKETWMDTGYGGEERDGARIEIQSLFLAQLSFRNYLTKLINLPEPEYMSAEKEFAHIVRKLLFKDGILYDGLNEKGLDNTARPNVFIAYYVYPQLLSRDEWKGVFRYVLGKLWLEWGGISTIDKKSPLFCPSYTGQDDRSYHRGDSWFFLNNMAAISLYRLDKTTFKSYIQNIINASCRELLFGGFIGHHAELSSANHLSSAGCFAQAWSAALLIELLSEVKNPKLLKK